jgi:hypothetical protein
MNDAIGSQPPTEPEGGSAAASERLGPVFLILHRGGWCPYRNPQPRTFQGPRTSWSRRIRISWPHIAISPKTPDHSLSMTERKKLGVAVLSNHDAQVIDRYRLKCMVDVEARALLEAAGNDLGAYNGRAGLGRTGARNVRDRAWDEIRATRTCAATGPSATSPLTCPAVVAGDK